MSFQFNASRILHEDHMASLALLGEIERKVLTLKELPPRDDANVGRAIRTLRDALAGEVAAHFDFEEETLFPYLVEFGEGDLSELLSEEHRVLREVFAEVDLRIAAGFADGFDPAGWTTFRRLCGELIERLQSHIEKEERALLPALENTLTSEADAEYCARHDI